MLDALYNRYADLVREKSAIEEEMEKCRAEILADMTHHGIDNFKRDCGTFSITQRSTFVFSGEVDKLTAAVAERKELEKEKGIALVETTPVLAFRAKK